MSTSKGTKRRSIPIGKVPSVKELCELLGFQYASIKETNAFMKATHSWRKNYKAVNGQLGIQLLHWNDPSTQLELQEMAEKFVSHDKNGETFWSPNTPWNRGSDLEYPEDKARIVELLKQLFFRQNRYMFNNIHYGNPGAGSQDGSRESATPGLSEPEINSAKTSSTATMQTQPTHNSEDKLDTTSHIPSRSISQSIQRQSESGNVSLEKGMFSSFDIYEVPDDPHEQDKGPGRTLSESDRSNNGSKDNKLIEDTQSAAKKMPQKRKRKTRSTESLRRTPRKRVPRVVPETMPDDEFEEILRAADDSDSSSDSQDRREVEQYVFRRSPKGVAPTAPMFTSQQPNNRGEVPRREYTESTRRRSKIIPVQNQKVSQGNFQKQRGIATAADFSSHHITSKKSNVRPDASDSSRRKTHAPKPAAVEGESRASPIYIGETRESLETSNSGRTESHNRTTGHGAMSGLEEDKIEDITASRANINESTTSETRYGKPHFAASPHHSKAEKFPVSSPAPSPRVDSASKAASSEGSPLLNSKPRSKTQIPLWVITRLPRYTEERWSDGKFQTTLSNFIEGLSKITQRTQIDKIKLTLRTPTSDTKVTLLKDDEDLWFSTKADIVSKLKEAGAEARAGRGINFADFKILIEPVYEEVEMSFGVVVDDDEEWFELC